MCSTLDAFLCFRIETLSRQYTELEDEFRMALQIEANRFKEVQNMQSSTVDVLLHVGGGVDWIEDELDWVEGGLDWVEGGLD